MAFKKTVSKGRRVVPSSSRAGDAGGAAANASPSRSAKKDAPFIRPRNLRSSGKRPLTAEEADRYEALARRRRPSRAERPDPDVIEISDDGEEESATFPSGPQSWPKPGSPDSTNIGSQRWGPPVDHGRVIPRIPPIAAIDPAQGSVSFDPNTTWGALQLLENASKQAISAIGARLGSLADFRPSLLSFLGEVRRIGGDRLAKRCDRKLAYWARLAQRLERLVYCSPINDVTRLIGEARVRIMREREARAERISEQEAIIAELRERQYRLQREMGAHTAVVAPAGGPSTLENLKRESAYVHRAFSSATQTLLALQREEEASIAALSEERLEAEAEAQVKAIRERELANTEAEIEAFTLFDCLN